MAPWILFKQNTEQNLRQFITIYKRSVQKGVFTQRRPDSRCLINTERVRVERDCVSDPDVQEG